MSAKEEFEKKIRAFVGQEIGPAELGADRVNEPMIRHWFEVLGDRNPVYLDAAAAARSVHGGLVAPPAMLQAWILEGFGMSDSTRGPRDKQQELHRLFDEAGYTGVVATDCEQGYDRYLRPGDEVSATTVIESISGEKATALGIGYFTVTRTTFRDQKGEQVGWMTFRVLKFIPQQQPQAASEPSAAAAKARRIRPVVGHDNGWWWDKVQQGELHIQKCSACGELRHPPRPMCSACRSLEWESVQASGRGEVHSYVILHHPPLPGYELPLPIVLVDLDEGTRLVANVAGCANEDVHIGMPVQASVEDVEEDWKLPVFRPALPEG